MYKVFVDGRAGTTGLRIVERLAADPEITLLTLPEETRKEAAARQEMLHTADLAFLCLPDTVAKEAVELARGARVRLIDASTAHRMADGWAYGFPELSKTHREQVRQGARVAVPGCHASGYIALVYPLVQAGVLPEDALLCCTSITGYSGGGKPMIADYEEDFRDPALDSPRHYATGQVHKHLPEMARYTGLPHAPVFNPVVADFYAGMLVSVPLHGAQLKGVSGLLALREIYEAHYAGQRLVQVLPVVQENMLLAAGALAGKDCMELLVTGNEERITLYARYDNLGKGASGAAIQCMNTMLGREETAGLVV